MNGKAAYWEICNAWSLIDLYKCCEMLEIEAALEEESNEKMRRQYAK